MAVAFAVSFARRGSGGRDQTEEGLKGRSLLVASGLQIERINNLCLMQSFCRETQRGAGGGGDEGRGLKHWE